MQNETAEYLLVLYNSFSVILDKVTVELECLGAFLSIIIATYTTPYNLLCLDQAVF